MTAQLPLTPQEKRRHQNRETARRSILDATEALLVAEGYERFSMRRLAKRCGYTAPTIYHYFGDKRGLLDALLDERFQLLVDLILAVPRDADAAASLRAQLAAFVGFGLDHPTHYLLLMEPRPVDSPPAASAERSRSLLEATLSQLADENRLQLDDIEEAVQCIWAMLHGLVSLRISRPEHPWTSSHVDVCLDILMAGLVASPRRNHGPAAPAPKEST